MPNINASLPLARRTLHVFYVLDTSGSMRGLPIQRLNRAMKESLTALKAVAETNGNAELQIAVMQYSSNWRWMQPAGPERAEDFIWEDMAAGGTTNIGPALDELNKQLSPDRFLRSSTGALMPVIIFMTDGRASDDHYEDAISRINKNPYFKGATRVGFAIGEDPDVAMISSLAGNPEAVIRTDNLGLFANLIRFVSASASKRASVSHRPGDGDLGPSVVRDALAQAGGGRNADGMTVEVSPEEVVAVRRINDGNHSWDVPAL